MTPLIPFPTPSNQPPEIETRTEVPPFPKHTTKTPERRRPSPWELMEKDPDTEGIATPTVPFTPPTPEMTEDLSPPAMIRLLVDAVANESNQILRSTDTTTSFVLNTSQWRTSPLYGTRITVREYSTAPATFNIEIATSPVALAHLQAHQSSLMMAFAEHRSLFSVHRLDLELNTPAEKGEQQEEHSQEETPS